MNNSISSMSHEQGKKSAHSVWIDDIGDASIDRTMKVLAGFGHDAQRAIGSALKRATQSSEAYAAQALGKEYYVKSADFKKYTKVKRHYVSDNGSITAKIEFCGYHIPLLKFNTKITKNGRVSAQVMRSSVPTVLNHIFVAQMGSHIGLYERVGAKRFPVEEKFGPATTQMMYSNEEITDAVSDRIKEVFDNRIEHEILAIMNGWRKDGKQR